MINKDHDHRYDAWLFWNIAFRCNLDCEYCNASNPRKMFKKVCDLGIMNSAKIISTNLMHVIRQAIKRKSLSEFKLLRNKFFSGDVRVVNVDALLRTLEATRRIFRITFTGGEPFLVSNFIEACAEITKKHYIAVISNLTSSQVGQFSTRISPDRVAIIVASLHIKELEKRGLFEKYIEHFFLLKNRGFNISARAIAHPSLVADVERYRSFFINKGIEIRFDPFQGCYKGQHYPFSYTDFEVKAFGFDLTFKRNVREVHAFFKEAYSQRGKICNAGYNAGIVWASGDIQPCFSIGQDMGNIYKEIRFNNSLIRCPYCYCSCPLNFYDRNLFQQAMNNETATS